MRDAQAGDGKVTPETLARIEAVIFDPRRCTNAGAALRAAAEFLRKDTLDAQTLSALGEAEAVSLADALERAYPDKGAAARRATEDFLDRP